MESDHYKPQVICNARQYADSKYAAEPNLITSLHFKMGCTAVVRDESKSMSLIFHKDGNTKLNVDKLPCCFPIWLANTQFAIAPDFPTSHKAWNKGEDKFTAESKDGVITK